MRKTKLFSLLAVLLCSATMWADVAVNGKLPGAFSVSADKQVYFSQGNLQFTRTSTSVDWSTGTFSFMAKQYDIIETGGWGIIPYARENYAYETAIGLFSWATSNLNTPKANTYYYPWMTDIADYSDYGSGITEGNVNWSDNNNEFANYDWGTAMGSGWRTLTKDEWGYLFESRTGDKASTVNGTADIRFAMATVNGVNGVILFPNGGTFAADEFDAVGDLNHAGEEADSPTTTTCDLAKWSALEAKGCVFLPAAGARVGDQFDNNKGGCYWSSTSFNTEQAYYVEFGNPYLLYRYNDRYLGYSVRLVSETAPASTPTTPETSDNADGIETAMAALIGAGTTDLIINRTLYKDGFFNTLCLPFSLTEEELAASPLAGCQLYSLSDADYDGENLNLTIAEESTIEAGMPYLIKWPYGENITSMTFTGVTVTASTGSTVTKGTGNSQVKFVGTIGRSTLPADNTNYLFVAANDNLKYAQAGDVSSMKGFRAYFIVGSETSTDIPHQVPARLVIAPKMPTAVENVQGDKVQCTKVIENGQLYIMYKGTKYNVQGKVVK